jgi:hypothetical protein
MGDQPDPRPHRQDNTIQKVMDIHALSGIRTHYTSDCAVTVTGYLIFKDVNIT